MNRCYKLHGLMLRTDLDLSAQLAVDWPPGVPSVVLDWGVVPSIDDVVPHGHVVLDLLSDAGSHAWLVSTEQGQVMRIPGLVDAWFDLDGGTIRIQVMEGGVDYLPILVGGLFSAIWISLAGDLALHASAIQHDGRLYLLAGPSGQGKSTTALLMAMAGGRTFGDDVIRLRFDGDGVTAERGVPELRLRSAALLDTPEAALLPSRHTADHRSAVEMPMAAEITAKPSAIVLPRPDRSRLEIALRVLDHEAAFLQIHRGVRLTGWTDPDMIARQFDQLAALAEQVPVVEALIPWADPPLHESGRQLLVGLSDLFGA